MATVKKGNRVLTVEESTVNTYLKQGYDQVELAEDEKSYEVVKRATGGKQVSYSEYVDALEEKEKLEAEIAELKAEVKTLKAENTKLKKADA